MGHAAIILKMVDLALAHAGEIIDLAKDTSDDVKQVAASIKRLHDEVKAKNEQQ
jgi:hypothetical protein